MRDEDRLGTKVVGGDHESTLSVRANYGNRMQCSSAVTGWCVVSFSIFFGSGGCRCRVRGSRCGGGSCGTGCSSLRPENV